MSRRVTKLQPMSHPAGHPPRTGSPGEHPHAQRKGTSIRDFLPQRATWAITAANVAKYVAWALWALGVGMRIDAHSGANWVMLLGLLGAALATAIAAYLQVEKPRAAEQAVRSGLLAALWKRAEYTPPAAGAGADVALMTQSVERYTNNQHGFRGQLAAALWGPLLVLVLMAVAIDWVVALAVAVVLPGAPLAIGWFQRRFRAASGESRKMRAQLAGQFTAMVRGLETIVLNQAGPRVRNQLAHAGEQNRQATMRVLSRNQIVLLVAEAGFALTTIAVTTIVALLRMDAGAITAGTAVAAILASIVLTTPLQLVGSFFYIGMTGRAAAGAIGRFRARMRAVDSAHTEAEVTETDQPLVACQDVALQRGRYTLARGISLRAEPGAPVVVKGPSGAGKSTLLGVLHGVVSPASGQVILPAGGSALIAQRTWMFTGTLRENLLLANADATEEQLTEVLERVGLGELVRTRGLDGSIGEDAAALSAGQAQRVSIARALLAGRNVLLCDEPTANLDPGAAAGVLELLAQLSRTHAVVLVTHDSRATLPGASDLTIEAASKTEQSPACGREPSVNGAGHPHRKAAGHHQPRHGTSHTEVTGESGAQRGETTE